MSRGRNLHDRVAAEHSAIIKCEKTIVAPSSNDANRSRIPNWPDLHRPSYATHWWVCSKIECRDSSDYRRGTKWHVHGHDESKEVGETSGEAEREWSWNVQLLGGSTEDPVDTAGYRIVQDKDDDNCCDMFRNFPVPDESHQSLVFEEHHFRLSFGDLSLAQRASEVILCHRRAAIPTVIMTPDKSTTELSPSP